MTYRRPSDLQRENTEPKPNIHEERNERAARIEDDREEQFAEQVDEKSGDDLLTEFKEARDAHE